jgi:DNA repair protein RecO (recombination protein O)
MTLLKDLGFGLDLRKCVVTGSDQSLSFVSPKSGCAVSDIAAVGYEKKLLILPQFLLNTGSVKRIPKKEFEDAFKMTGYFLKKWLLPVKSFNTDILFEARRRLLYSLE